MTDFWPAVVEFVNATQVLDQLRTVDLRGLFTNWYFLIPLIVVIGYNLYKQAFTNLVLVGLGFGLWAFTGSPYMQNLVVDGQLDIGKILPVAAVWVVAIAIAVYLLFMRSD